MNKPRAWTDLAMAAREIQDDLERLRTGRRWPPRWLRRLQPRWLRRLLYRRWRAMENVEPRDWGSIAEAAREIRYDLHRLRTASAAPALPMDPIADAGAIVRRVARELQDRGIEPPDLHRSQTPTARRPRWRLPRWLRRFYVD